MTDSFEQKNKQLFTRTSKRYDSPLGGGWYFRALYKRAEAMLPPLFANSPSLLDVACGTGEIIFHLAKKFPNSTFTGSDFTPAMLEKAKEKNASFTNVTFVEASAQALPFSDASFDIILCTEAFHHFSEPEKALQEIFRVIKPGGHFLLVDPVRDTFFGRFLLHWFSKHLEHAFHYYSSEELAIGLENAGFRIKTAESGLFNRYILSKKN